MYCVYCGVKLQDGAKECPLCHTPVMIARPEGMTEKSSYSDLLPEEDKFVPVTGSASGRIFARAAYDRHSVVCVYQNC